MDNVTFRDATIILGTAGEGATIAELLAQEMVSSFCMVSLALTGLRVLISIDGILCAQ